MKLIGQYDSPFVRRVAVCLHHYAIPFERKILSVFTDFDEMLRINPLGRVPVLELDAGERLFDSRYILDYVDEIGAAENRLVPSGQPRRRRILNIDAVSLGLAEKVYARSFELSRRPADKRDEQWIQRLRIQINSALSWLEQQSLNPFFHGPTITRADITCATAYRFLLEKQPRAFDRQRYQNIDRHLRVCEALTSFQAAAYSAAEARASGWSPGEV